MFLSVLKSQPCFVARMFDSIASLSLMESRKACDDEVGTAYSAARAASKKIDNDFGDERGKEDEVHV